jgi:arginyl-tRNA synthetase
MMEGNLKELIVEALVRAKEAGELKYSQLPEINLERPADKSYGDITTTVAMTLASQERKSPRVIAETILKYMRPAPSWIERREIAGPGFINFYLSPSFWHNQLLFILNRGDRFGASDHGKGMRVQIEFVSANPTGPLHVGHGRNAAVGDVLARILTFSGYQVEKEFYINDFGNQIELLGQSVWSRYMELNGKSVPFPENGYHGDYVYEIAREIIARKGTELVDKDPAEVLPFFAEFASQAMLERIKADLEAFRVTFDSWFSEKSLYQNGSVAQALEVLKSKGFIYEQDGALWFRSTQFGDDKDRVVIRSDGRPTYLASDIAYHQNKLQRGFSKLINVWGADHGGYVPRIKGIIKALGYPEDILSVVLIQLVRLMREGVEVKISKRSGKLILLSDLVEEVGVDATRFFFTMRRTDSHLDFDLELAKSQSKDNPVYYVQYVHARICSLFREAKKLGILLPSPQEVALNRLDSEEELSLIKELYHFPKVVLDSALSLEPHRITFYLQNLAGIFHSYYNKYRFISDDLALTDARLTLAKGVQIVLKNALDLLGVSAPEVM